MTIPRHPLEEESERFRAIAEASRGVAMVLLPAIAGLSQLQLTVDAGVDAA